jgi:hypothetical protein
MHDRGTPPHIQRFGRAHGVQDDSFNLLCSLLNVVTPPLAGMACIAVHV